MKTIPFAYPAGVCLLMAYTAFLARFSHAGFPPAMSVVTPSLANKHA